MKAAIADIARNRSASFGLPTRAKSALAAQSIVHAKTDVQLKPPPDLDEIAARIIAEYRSGLTPGRRDLHKAPWCIWNGKHPIADDESVLREFLTYVETLGGNRLFRRLASVFLVKFPKNRKGFSDVARILARVAPRFDGPWSKASFDLSLFDPVEGPLKLVKAAFTAGRAPLEILESFGIANLPTNAKYIETAFLLGLDAIREDPSR